MSVGPFKPLLYMIACLALGGLIVGLLEAVDASRRVVRLAGNISFVGAFGWCMWRDGVYRPGPVLASGLAVVAVSLALLFVGLMILPVSSPPIELLFNVFDLGPDLEGGIHGPPLDLFVAVWSLWLLGLIGAGLLLAGLLRLGRPRPAPDGESGQA